MLRSNQIDPIQAGILHRLSKGGNFRFAQLNLDKISSDQFSYHIRRLQHIGLIEKQADGTYALSVEGKNTAEMLHPESHKYKQQGFTAVRIVLAKTEESEEHFLLLERGIEPYRGMIQTPGGWVPFGSTVGEAARHYARLQTGLDCDVEARGLAHFIDEHKGRIVQDRYFIVVVAANPQGQLADDGPFGKNIWLSRDQVQKSPRSFDGLLEIIDMAQDPQFGYIERKFTVQDY